MSDLIEGTKERKRRLRAMPAALSSNIGAFGCVWATAIFAVLFSIGYRATRWRVWLFLLAPALIVVAGALVDFLYGMTLRLRAALTLERQGVRCLVIHSRSPRWEDHIASHWLPRLGPVARTLDWSERANWQRSLEVRLFRRYVDGPLGFNPAVLVLRGMRPPLVYRFFYAFREAKAGRPQYLAILEEEMFRELRV